MREERKDRGMKGREGGDRGKSKADCRSNYKSKIDIFVCKAIIAHNRIPGP